VGLPWLKVLRAEPWEETRLQGGPNFHEVGRCYYKGGSRPEMANRADLRQNLPVALRVSGYVSSDVVEPSARQLVKHGEMRAQEIAFGGKMPSAESVERGEIRILDPRRDDDGSLHAVLPSAFIWSGGGTISQAYLFDVPPAKAFRGEMAVDQGRYHRDRTRLPFHAAFGNTEMRDRLQTMYRAEPLADALFEDLLERLDEASSAAHKAPIKR
jgi:hypothetical protein